MYYPFWPPVASQVVIDKSRGARTDEQFAIGTIKKDFLGQIRED